MAAPTVYPIYRGQTATLFVEAVTGDPTTASSPTCKVKPISGPNVPAPDQSIAAVLTLTPALTTASGSIGPGWTIVLTAVQTAALAAGYYMIDFACTVAGGEVVTSPVVLQIVNAVSLP